MFSLTHQERQVLIFLVSVSLAGAGTNFLGKRYAVVRSLSRPSEDILKIDLNKADKETLLGVPGVGEKLSARILDYQRQNGFQDLEDLKKIKGITSARYEKLKELFCVK